MRRIRFGGAWVVAFSAGVAGMVAGAAPAGADTAAGYRLEAGRIARRAPEAPPLKLAEALSVEALARLAPAASAARAELAAMAANNSNPRRPHQVGFARELAVPFVLAVDSARLGEQIGERVGGGFLSRERGGDFVWGTSVSVDSARGLRLELSAVNLPVGTRFWVWGADGGAREFDLRLRSGDGTIVSPVVEGDTIYLEVQLPSGRIGSGQGFELRRVHELVVSRSALVPFATEANACLQNGECYDAGDFPGIGIARNGVFQYFFTSGGSSYTCSGGLLDDNAPSTLEPWLLTAHHCVNTDGEADTLDSAFLWRYNSCGSSSSTYELGPLGADLIVTSDDTDVTLLRAHDLTDVPDVAQFLPWTSGRPGDGTVLHRLSHPVFDNPSPTPDQILPQVYSSHQLDETPAHVCTDITVERFLHSVNTGGTGISGGSSGSPIFRSDGYVVGQLLGSCGNDPDGCGTDENILDGAFSASYSLLRPYLSPEGEVCVRDADTACLLDGRFRVEVDWATASGNGNAQVMYFNGERAENVESVFFWFFNASNFEMGVKGVDACVPPFNRFWFFVSGLTSQGYTVAVTKMSTGETKYYSNAINEIPTTDADTNAFLCN